MNDFDRLFDVTGLSLDRLRSFLRVVEAGNLTKAAQGDVTKQSQFSRQIKELEGFFGVALTRRVGRRIEITEAGHHLALVIRRQFRELDDFREAMAGRSLSVRFGAQGSVIDWLLSPRLEQIRKTLGNALVEMEQLRSLDVVRGVADGRLDFGIVRDNAVPRVGRRWKLGAVGYSVIAANGFWKGGGSATDVLRQVPVVELLSDGHFSEAWREWLIREKITPRIVARVSSFTVAARVVQAGHAAAMLPEIAAVDFNPKQFRHAQIDGLKPRSLVLIANTRNLERAGLPGGVETRLAGILRVNGS